jgi:V/A-type H+-transporting ATPase subunit D
MPRLNVPLTRSTLLETQRTLSFAKEGYDLLDRKREVLVTELVNMMDDAEAAESEMGERLASAQAKLARAKVSMGVEEIRRAALSIVTLPEVKVTERSIMGAIVPIAELSPAQVRLHYSFTGTTVALDEAVRAFTNLLASVVDAAEIEVTIWRLAQEVKKTQRRVNALSNIIIPELERIIKAVQEALE